MRNFPNSYQSAQKLRPGGIGSIYRGLNKGDITPRLEEDLFGIVSHFHFP